MAAGADYVSPLQSPLDALSFSPCSDVRFAVAVPYRLLLLLLLLLGASSFPCHAAFVVPGLEGRKEKDRAGGRCDRQLANYESLARSLMQAGRNGVREGLKRTENIEDMLSGLHEMAACGLLASISPFSFLCLTRCMTDRVHPPTQASRAHSALPSVRSFAHCSFFVPFRVPSTETTGLVLFSALSLTTALQPTKLLFSA